MITKTALTHPTLACKLHGAMIRATQQSRYHNFGVSIVRNEPTLVVIHERDKYQSSFTFYDTNSRDITTTVLEALRS